MIAFLLLRLQRANGFDHIHPGRYSGLCASGAFSPFAKHQYFTINHFIRALHWTMDYLDFQPAYRGHNYYCCPLEKGQRKDFHKGVSKRVVAVLNAQQWWGHKASKQAFPAVLRNAWTLYRKTGVPLHELRSFRCTPDCCPARLRRSLLLTNYVSSILDS